MSEVLTAVETHEGMRSALVGSIVRLVRQDHIAKIDICGGDATVPVEKIQIVKYGGTVSADLDEIIEAFAEPFSDHPTGDTSPQGFFADWGKVNQDHHSIWANVLLSDVPTPPAVVPIQTYCKGVAESFAYAAGNNIAIAHGKPETVDWEIRNRLMIRLPKIDDVISGAVEWGEVLEGIKRGLPHLLHVPGSFMEFTTRGLYFHVNGFSPGALFSIEDKENRRWASIASRVSIITRAMNPA